MVTMELARWLRIPYANQALEARRLAAQDQSDQFIMDLVNESFVRLGIPPADSEQGKG